MDRREFLKSSTVAAASLPLLASSSPGKEAIEKASSSLPGFLTKENFEEVKKQIDVRPNTQATDEEWAAYLIRQWERTGLLKELPEEQKPTVVLALENQRVWNQGSEYRISNIAQFKRISIPLIRRLVPRLMEQMPTRSSFYAKAPMMLYVPRSKHRFNGVWNKTSWELFMQYQAWGRGECHNLDKEAEEVGELADHIMDDVNWIFESHNLGRIGEPDTFYFYCFGMIPVVGGLSSNGYCDGAVRPQMVLFYEWV